MNNPLIQDHLIALTMVIIVIAYLLLRKPLLRIVIYLYNRLKIEPTKWRPSDIYPNCDDQRNIIDVRIKNITDENAEEVIGYFDVSMQRYHDYQMNVIDYEFMWCYE